MGVGIDGERKDLVLPRLADNDAFRVVNELLLLQFLLFATGTRLAGPFRCLPKKEVSDEGNKPFRRL